MNSWGRLVLYLGKVKVHSEEAVKVSRKSVLPILG